jgi:hypothetical protein
MLHEVRIRSVPPDAAVYLDGEKYRERTPTVLSSMRSGSYELRISKDGYESYRGLLVLEERNPVVTVSVELLAQKAPPVAPAPTQVPAASVSSSTSTAPVSTAAARSGTLTLAGNQPAIAFLGKTRLGPLPLNGVKVPAGQHKLRLENRQLRLARTVTLQVKPNEDTQYLASFGKGTLNVLATPWADVWLDGENLGQTPLAGREAWEGPHQLRLVNPSGEKTLTIQIVPGETAVIRERIP